MRNALLPSLLTVLIGITTLLSASAQAEADKVLPFAFNAQYQVHARGMSVGRAEFRLTPNERGDVWHFSTHTKPSGWVKMLAGARDDNEQSWLQFTPQGMRSLRYAYHSPGKKKGRRQAEIDFDWSKSSAQLNREGERETLPLDALSFDRLSLNLALGSLLKHAPEAREINVLGPRGVRPTQIRIEPHPPLRVPYGEFPVIKVTRVRGKRTMLSWHAPALGYLPIQLEQYKSDKRQARMQLKQFTTTP